MCYITKAAIKILVRRSSQAKPSHVCDYQVISQVEPLVNFPFLPFGQLIKIFLGYYVISASVRQINSWWHIDWCLQITPESLQIITWTFHTVSSEGCAIWSQAQKMTHFRWSLCAQSSSKCRWGEDYDFRRMLCNKTEPEVTQFKMLSFCFVVSFRGSMKKEQIRGADYVRCF